MDITTENFNENLQEIVKAIKKCQFIAMDTEFTGLNIGDKATRYQFDKANVLYKKHKYVCERFQAVQVGLCIFTWDAKNNSYISRPYNFYVLPKSELEGENIPMMFDPETCEFLQKYNFNWNSLFKSGLSYKQMERKGDIIAKCTSAITNGFRPERKRSFISAKGKRNLKRYMKEIQDFCFNKGQNKIEFEEDSLLVRNEIKKQLFKQINSQGCLDVLSDDDNPSKLIVSKNKNFNHDSFCSIDTNDEDDCSICEVSKSSESLHSLDEQIEKVKKLKEKETNDKIDELFVKEYGFTAIVEEIIRCEKPIIGHNCFFDMVYFYRQFVGNLPDSFKEFKEKWRKSFKSTFDTKYISSIIPKMVNSSLGQVYKTCCEGAKYKELVSFKFKDGFDRYKKETKCHEAGYDAHMTGHIFATLCKYREVECKVEQERKEMEGIDLNQDDGNDNTEEQKMYRDAMREKQRVPIDLSFLEECRLKIVKNISGGNYFDLASNDIENDDSNNSDDKIQEIIENKSNTIWIEYTQQEDFKSLEKYLKEIGDYYIEDSSTRGYLIEIKSLDKSNYNDINHLIEKLSNDSNFPWSILSYKDYIKNVNLDQ